MKLSIRHERFCNEYIKSGNATQAYKLAGYADTPNARANVHRLLRKDSVKQRIIAIRADIAVETGITRETEAKRLTTLIERLESSGNDRLLLKAIELRCKLYGLLIDRGIITDTVQERQLTEAEQIEGKRLAILMLNQKYNKPDITGKQEDNKAG